MLSIIPSNDPIVDKNGIVTIPWGRWFDNLYKNIRDIDDSTQPIESEVDIDNLFTDTTSNSALSRTKDDAFYNFLEQSVVVSRYWFKLATNAIYSFQRIIIGSTVDDGINMLQVTGDAVINGNLNVTTGASGTFTTADLKTVTVVNGIVTSII